MTPRTRSALSVAAALAMPLLTAVVQAAPATQPEAAAKVASSAATRPAAVQPTLKVGDPAPALEISKWVKGEPVNGLEKGKVYVMEFWATWCGPCIAAMPHVSEVQKTYADKGVVVIGVNIWERSVADLEKIPEFVKERGDEMAYRVAVDTYEEGAAGRPPTSKMSASWMRAAGRNGIPSTFIVDRDGRIAWMGHPMKLDGPLAKVVAGTFDPAAQAAADQKVEDLQKDAFAAVRAKDFDKALGLLDEIEKADPSAAESNKFTRVQWGYLKGDYAGANKLAAELAAAKTDAATANRLAMTMLTAPEQDKIDADLAVKLATQFAEAQRKNPKSAWIGDYYLAKAYYAKKDYAKAVECQKKAMEGAPAARKSMFEADLKKYQEKAAVN